MLLYTYRFQILALLFLLTLVFFWPGIPMHDSTVQYQQAISSMYSDHHPPMMAFVWHYLNKLYPGSGLMFVLQLGLLYSAIAVLLRTTDYLPSINRVLATVLLLLLPIYPQILIYAVVILKDVQFATSFLFAGAILAYYSVQKRQLPWYLAFLVFLLLLYGTAVKFQAQYVVIIFACWLGIMFNRSKNQWQGIITGLLIFCCIFAAVFCINNKLILAHKNYAWQYVKLYDLAAMSLVLDTDLMPDSNKTADYAFSKLQQRFKYPAIDSLVFMQEPLLTVTSNAGEMQNLKSLWRHEIRLHPLIYFKHRLINMRYILCARPGYGLEAKDVPVTFLHEFQQNPTAKLIIAYTIGILFFIFMSHVPVILLGILYLILAIRAWGKTSAAPILFAFASTALCMVVLLFFMSMAGTPRYTFVSILLIHAANVCALTIILPVVRVRMVVSQDAVSVANNSNG